MSTTLFSFGALRRQTRTGRHAMGLHEPRRHGSHAACLWLLLMMVVPGAVQAQFRYMTNNGAITLTSYSGAGDVVIPNFVTSIGVTAFYNCSSLTNVTIPNSVTSIGEAAFRYCSSLTSITIPDSVTNIGNRAFSACSRLMAITVNSTNPIYSSTGGVLFNKSQNQLVCYPGGKKESYIIPDSVTSIGDFAFTECTSLTNITIPKSVTSIGGSAFSSCSRLTSITIPDSVTRIGDVAFYFCSSLTNVIIPNSVTSIGASVFCSCSNLTSVTIPNGVAKIGDGAFYNCTSLTNVTIPNSVSSIGSQAFWHCSNLNNVTIPASVTTVDTDAFIGCSGLRRAYFGGNAPLLGYNVFGYESLATIYYLPGTTDWGSTFGERPALLWNPVIQTSASSFGVQTNRFGFDITGTADIPILIEGCTNLAEGVWVPRESVSLTNGSYYFSDAEWMNYPNCLYRIRSP